MSKVKILFLDMDGVINSKWWYDNRPNEPNMGRRDELYTMIDPDAVDRLNIIMSRTGCLLVLSSSWRSLDPISTINSALRLRNLAKPLFGITPSLGNPRGKEIQAWLDMAGSVVESFTILDDDSDMEHLLPKLVQTSWDFGLQNEHVERAVEMLNEPSP